MRSGDRDEVMSKTNQAPVLKRFSRRRMCEVWMRSSRAAATTILGIFPIRIPFGLQLRARSLTSQPKGKLLDSTCLNIKPIPFLSIHKPNSLYKPTKVFKPTRVYKPIPSSADTSHFRKELKRLKATRNSIFLSERYRIG